MVNRVVVMLEQDEYSALLEMSIDDLRNPSDQLRHILRMEIEKRMSNPKDVHEIAEIKTNTLKEIQS